MEPDSGRKRDRYDTSGNVEAEYVDPERTILVNKKGITDLETLQRTEAEALVQAYDALLAQVRTDTPMTCALLRHVHERIFGELYEWAGRWRTVWISKPGITWPAPDFLDGNMAAYEADVLRKYPAQALKDDDAFCRAAGEIQGEFLVIHPFREGNARTIKLVTDLLAAQTERPLLVYDQSDQGRERYTGAAKAAFKRNYGPMTEIIRQALAEARDSRRAGP
jgi:cell filamentation protein